MEIKAIETVYNGYIYSGKPPIPSKKKMSERVNLKGKKFGRLMVVEDLGITHDGGYRLWGCECDCGSKKAVRSRELMQGHTKSCGCLSTERLIAMHDKNKLPEGESAFNSLYSSYKKSAMRRNYPWELTIDEFKVLTKQDCYYCGIPPSNIVYKGFTNGGYLTNGVDRINNLLGYTLANARSCCKQCNIAKGVLSEDEFYKWVKAVARKARFEHGECG